MLTPHYLRKRDIAAVFNTSPNGAARILAEHDIYPVDLGAGRGNGLRWLASAVYQVANDMHAAAQAAHSPKAPKSKINPAPSLLGMSVNDVYALTQSTVQ